MIELRWSNARQITPDRERLEADAHSHRRRWRNAASRNAKNVWLERRSWFHPHHAEFYAWTGTTGLASFSGDHGRILRRAGDDSGLLYPDRGFQHSRGYD